MIICCKDHTCCFFSVSHFIIIEGQYVILWNEENVHTLTHTHTGICARVLIYFTIVFFEKFKWEIVFVKTGYLINETNMWLLFLLSCAYSSFICPRG